MIEFKKWKTITLNAIFYFAEVLGENNIHVDNEDINLLMKANCIEPKNMWVL